MSTSYQLIFDKFVKKLQGDTQFFDYKDLSVVEINEQVEGHLISLLNTSIDKIYFYGSPDIDFYNKDDTLEVFNIDLVNQEISLLVDIMYFAYAEEDRNKLKAYGLVFRSSEMNVLFSPANDRKTYLDMIEKIETNVVNAISNYLSRDRITWKLKSIYGDSQ